MSLGDQFDRSWLNLWILRACVTISEHTSIQLQSDDVC